jgi:hypothetical protein
LASEFLDIEDGFQYFAALAGGAGVIVTRNKKSSAVARTAPFL